MLVIPFWTFCLVLSIRRSSNVGSGAPNLVGSSSDISTNSSLQILSAVFNGTGGEPAPMTTESPELTVATADNTGALRLEGIGVVSAADNRLSILAVSDEFARFELVLGPALVNVDNPASDP